MLELTSAYDRVFRSLLIYEVNRRLPENMATILSAMLNPNLNTTPGRNSQTRGSIKQRVPQQSPFSPKLFKLFMDPYAEHLRSMLEEKGENEEECKVTIFVGNPKLMAKSPALLRELLHLSTEWCGERV